MKLNFFNLKSWGTKGIILDQKKEPALSRDLQQFVSTLPTASSTAEPLKDGETADLNRLIELCQEANIIDEREGMPLAELLKPWLQKPCKKIVGDAIDDEPYVSSQINPLLKLSTDAAYGLRLLQTAIKPEQTYFAVYKEMYYLNSRIPMKLEEFPVKKIGGRYPMEKRAVYRSGSRTLTVGTGALIHLARAAREGTVQNTCFVTVAGNCVGNPCNLEVTVGTSVSAILDRCGLISEPTYICIGSAMKGIAVLDADNTLIRPNTSSVIALKELKHDLWHMDCIGCSRCVEVCPEGLNPMELYKAVEVNRRKTARKLGIDYCTGCAACSYVCPSRLELADLIQTKQGKWKSASVRKDEGENETVK